MSTDAALSRILDRRVAMNDRALSDDECGALCTAEESDLAALAAGGDLQQKVQGFRATGGINQVNDALALGGLSIGETALLRSIMTEVSAAA